VRVLYVQLNRLPQAVAADREAGLTDALARPRGFGRHSQQAEPVSFGEPVPLLAVTVYGYFCGIGGRKNQWFSVIIQKINLSPPHRSARLFPIGNTWRRYVHGFNHA